MCVCVCVCACFFSVERKGPIRPGVNGERLWTQDALYEWPQPSRPGECRVAPQEAACRQMESKRTYDD